MPEPSFGPDRDPETIPPILPLDALEALGDVGRRAAGPLQPRDWSPTAMGYRAGADNGDELAAAMGGLHVDEPVAGGGLALDDLLDPWAGEHELPASFPRR